MSEIWSHIEGDISELKDDVIEVKERLAGHEVRFDNGRKVMGDLKRELDDLKPKSPDWVKLLLAGLSIVGVLMGGQLWLTERFEERPTRSELEKAISPLREEKAAISNEIKHLREEQIEQRSLINHVKETQKTQTDQLSNILDRLPKRRGGR